MKLPVSLSYCGFAFLSLLGGLGKLDGQIVTSQIISCDVLGGVTRDGEPAVILKWRETTVESSNGRVIFVSNDNATYRFTFSSNPNQPYQVSADGSAPQPVPGGSYQNFVNSQCPNGTTVLSAPVTGHSLRKEASVTSSSLTAGQYFGRVALSDFNRDGNPDTAVIDATGVTINLYDAKSNLLSSKHIAIPNVNASLIAADLNGDGKYDLAVAVDPPTGAGNITVLLGNGDGTFGAPATYPAGPFPFYLAIADFNNDGKPDLAVSNPPTSASGAGTVAVLFGDGRGGFAAPVMYPAGNTPASLVADDFTGDGIPDIVVLEEGQNSSPVWTLAGRGDGTFKAAVSTPTPTASGYLSYADFDHDGKLDLLIADQGSSTMVLMPGKGDGTFGTPQRFASAAQAVSLGVLPLQDGNTAILAPDNIGSEVMLYFANPSGVINSPQVQTFGKSFVAVAAGDVNGDGKPDIVIADGGSSRLYTELSQGTAGLSSPQSVALPAVPAALALADLNHDGYADAVVATSSGLAVLKGSATGNLAAPQVFGGGLKLVSLVVADFNRDGKLDAAAATSGGGVQIFTGNGDGTFAMAAQIAMPAGMVPKTVVSADVNRDGNPDLIVALANSNFTGAGSIAVMLGNGDGTFKTASLVSLPKAVLGGLAVGDLNNDGIPDLAVALGQSGLGEIGVLLGKGDGSFGSPVLTSTTTAAPQLLIADMNGDGKADVIAADCCGLAEATFLAGKGDGTFQAEKQFPSGPNPVTIAVADFDGDKKLDLAIAGQLQGTSSAVNSGALMVISAAFRAAGNPVLTATVSSAADPHQATLAPNSLGSAYGTDLANTNSGPNSLLLVPSFGGTSVWITDSSGQASQAPLLYVSPGQVNFEVPGSVAAGSATLTVTSGDGTTSTATFQIAPVAPALFELNAAGLAAAQVLLVSNGVQTLENVYAVVGGQIVAQPVNIGSGADQAYLLLYATGLRAAGTSGVSVTVNGVSAPVLYAGNQGGFSGLDQVNVTLPASLAGAGSVAIRVQANGVAANPVNITVK